MMGDDFLLRALVAGFLVAVSACPMGCFVVWRRIAYFGDALSHAALLGVAAGLLLSVSPWAGVVVVSAAAGGIVALSRLQDRLAGDTVLGIMAHGALGLGLMMMALAPGRRVDLFGYLFGDLLAVTTGDVILTGLGAAAILTVLYFFWRPLLALTVSEELARADGIRVGLVHAVYMVLLALVVALAMRVVGILLVTSLLIIPAAAARRFSSTPEMMAFFAAILGCLAVAGGMGVSLWLDTPSGPSVVVAALCLFLAGQSPGLLTGLFRWMRRRPSG